MTVEAIQWLTAQWPASARVRALTTLRGGGCSPAPFASLNLAGHVGDAPECVQRNRETLRASAGLPAEPVWLNQVHGIDVVSADGQSLAASADACVAHAAQQVCVVLTADCLPVLFCDAAGSCIAAAHAGWRGLAQGILRATIGAMQRHPGQLLAWLGPAIEAEAFEVGDEVRAQFVARDPDDSAAFVRNLRGRWQADLYALARQDLARSGVTQVFGGGWQCHADAARFFSYRRDGRTGRMASMIWLE
jgi:YfiH family protein